MLEMISGVLFSRMTFARVHNSSRGVEKALSVVVPPARIEQMTRSMVWAMFVVPHTEPGIQTSDVELIFVRCSLQTCQNLPTVEEEKLYSKLPHLMDWGIV